MEGVRVFQGWRMRAQWVGAQAGVGGQRLKASVPSSRVGEAWALPCCPSLPTAVSAQRGSASITGVSQHPQVPLRTSYSLQNANAFVSTPRIKKK